MKPEMKMSVSHLKDFLERPSNRMYQMEDRLLDLENKVRNWISQTKKVNI